MILGVELHLFL